MSYERELLITLYQVIMLYNVLRQGWSVKMTGPKMYEFSRKYDQESYNNIDLQEFISAALCYKVKPLLL